MSIPMIGLDLAKTIFHVHGIDASGTVVLRRSLRRGQVERFFAALSPCVVEMEGVWRIAPLGRLLQRLGHAVRMMPAHYVKPSVKRNKTDGRDAEAICEAASRPTMRFVAIKSEDAQTVLALHRNRALLVRQRTMTANAMRAGLAEFGIVAAQGKAGLDALLKELAAGPQGLPEAARAALSLLAVQWETVDALVRKLEAQIARLARADAAARRLMEIPGVGPITASMVVAKVPDAGLFDGARDFAAWIGLTPRQDSTGGKQRSVGISKQGDRTLRQLLVLGATSQLRQARAKGIRDPWLRDLLARRPAKVVAVALAAKTARIIWALLETGERYRAKDLPENLPEGRHHRLPAAA